MGMAASQCRLLMLTAEMSRLELRAQEIANAKMVLSRRLSSISDEYTRAISNQHITMRVAADDGTIQTNELTASLLFSQGYAVQVGGTTYETLSSFQRKYGNCDKGGEDNNVLQFMLLNGQATIYKPGENVQRTPDEVTTMATEYYTTDDALAEAKYKKLTREVESKEEQLDTELQQVNTQHEAAQTEFDSVKNIIKKNVERTFGYFS